MLEVHYAEVDPVNFSFVEYKMKNCFNLGVMLYEMYTSLGIRLIFSRVVQSYNERLMENRERCI